jgi:hypothetical protein
MMLVPGERVFESEIFGIPALHHGGEFLGGLNHPLAFGGAGGQKDGGVHGLADPSTICFVLKSDLVGEPEGGAEDQIIVEDPGVAEKDIGAKTPRWNGR